MVGRRFRTEVDAGFGNGVGIPITLRGAIGSSLASVGDNRGINWASSLGKKNGPWLKEKGSMERKKKESLQERRNDSGIFTFFLQTVVLSHQRSTSMERKIVTETFPAPHVFFSLFQRVG